MSDSDAWLAERLARAPEPLRARLHVALRDTLPAARSPLPDQLRAVAESLMNEARHGPPTRDTALTLLAADALVTLACEYVADHEAERLGELR